LVLAGKPGVIPPPLHAFHSSALRAFCLDPCGLRRGAGVPEAPLKAVQEVVTAIQPTPNPPLLETVLQTAPLCGSSKSTGIGWPPGYQT